MAYSNPGYVQTEMIPNHVSLFEGATYLNLNRNEKGIPHTPKTPNTLSQALYQIQNCLDSLELKLLSPRLSASSVKRLANQRLHFRRNKDSDWLDAFKR
ncbi:hypothetical protein TNCV_4128301 [Trichonephila clavipes]|nr:hypothetical protein TNCV_4128301 [Trichonephila clavipes]